MSLIPHRRAHSSEYGREKQVESASSLLTKKFIIGVIYSVIGPAMDQVNDLAEALPTLKPVVHVEVCQNPKR